MEALEKFRTCGKCLINVLCTSRPGFSDIEDHFPLICKMDVQASDLDIQEYVRRELWRTGGLLGEIVSKDSELPTTAARRIAKKSDGV